MKINLFDLVLIGAGVFAAYAVVRVMRNKPGATSQAQPYATQITKYDGWEYFTDGTTIAPNGDYYFQGALIWKANP